MKRLCAGVLALATVVTTLSSTTVHAESKQYWGQSNERVSIVEKIMNDDSEVTTDTVYKGIIRASRI
ncbi:hypothetical protein ACQ1P6_10565 [Streptococcus pasteurianus]